MDTLQEEQENEVFNELERSWKATLPKYSFYDLIDFFPSGKGIIKRCLTEHIKQYRADLAEALEKEREFNNTVLSKVKYEECWFYEKLRDTFITGPLRKDREKKIKRNCFYLSALKPVQVHQSKNITPQNIEFSKTIPIETIYSGTLTKRGRTSVGLCPFHTERSGSFTVYHSTNTWWCYGCSTGGDAIDFMMKISGSDFVSAVKSLLK